MIELPISTGLGALRILGRTISWLARWWQRPFIVVSANASDPFIRTTPMNVDGLDPVRAVSDARATYYRLLVENRGGRSAQDCRLQIVGLLFVESGVWKRLTGWEPVDLIWSNRPGVSSIGLAARESAFCDVGHAFSNYIQSNRVRPTTVRELGHRQPQRQALFFLDGQLIPAAQRNALAAGVYALQMRMFSSNAKTKDFTCLLHFGGEFASLVDEVPDGTVFRIERRPPDENTLSSVGTPV
jgi:hypothetical protein